jgi:hypothetical protein
MMCVPHLVPHCLQCEGGKMPKKCEHNISLSECYVCASPKHGKQPKQEPAAWMYQGIKHDGTTHGPHLVWKPEHMDAMSAEKGAKAVPLYTAPCDQQATVKDFLQVAQKEREACAELAAMQACACCWGDEGQEMAAHIADVIRGRSLA